MNKLDFELNSERPKYANFPSILNSARSTFTSKRLQLQSEIAIGLIIYSREKTDSSGKAFVKSMYFAAGYDCMVKAGRDYKTVNRRLNRTARLAEFIGLEEISRWYSEADSQRNQVLDVVNRLARFEFETFDDVAELVGLPSGRSSPKIEAAVTLSVDKIREHLLKNYNDDELTSFAADLLNAVALRRDF